MRREGIPQHGDEVRGRGGRSPVQEDGIVHSWEARSRRDAGGPLQVDVVETDACADSGLPLRPHLVPVAHPALRMIVFVGLPGTGPGLSPGLETEVL